MQGWLNSIQSAGRELLPIRSARASRTVGERGCVSARERALGALTQPRSLLLALRAGKKFMALILPRAGARRRVESWQRMSAIPADASSRSAFMMSLSHKCHLVVTAWLSCLVCVSSLSAEEPISLRERFPAGYEYHVSTRVDLAGTLSVPPEKDKAAPKPLSVRGSSAIEYDERILDVAADNQVRKTVRLCRRTDFRRTVGDRPQETSLRPRVCRLVLLRQQNKEVPFSPDGPLTWGEIDLIRTDVFTPALAGLLPGHAVRLGDRWSATQSAIQELTDLERIDEGSLECRLEQFTSVEKRRHARIAFRGTIRGANEDGPNRQELDGYFFFDLESNHLSYLYLRGKHFMLDKDGKEVGRIEGRFVLTRQANTRAADLSETALRGVALEPNADNTLLLYDNADLGSALFVSPSLARRRRARQSGDAGRRRRQRFADDARSADAGADRRAFAGRIARLARQAASASLAH